MSLPRIEISWRWVPNGAAGDTLSSFFSSCYYEPSASSSSLSFTSPETSLVCSFELSNFPRRNYSYFSYGKFFRKKKSNLSLIFLWNIMLKSSSTIDPDPQNGSQTFSSFSNRYEKFIEIKVPATIPSLIGAHPTLGFRECLCRLSKCSFSNTLALSFTR